MIPTRLSLWFTSLALALVLTVGAPAQTTIRGWGLSAWDTAVTEVPAIQVSAGDYLTGVLRADGRIFVRGEMRFGQCDVPPLPTGMTYVRLSVGKCPVALRSDGNLVQWGPVRKAAVPTLPPGTSWIQFESSHLREFAYALRSDGVAVAFGYQAVGSFAPPSLPPGVHYDLLRAGGSHGLGIGSDGKLRAWGSNTYGQATVPPSLGNRRCAGRGLATATISY